MAAAAAKRHVTHNSGALEEVLLAMQPVVVLCDQMVPRAYNATPCGRPGQVV